MLLSRSYLNEKLSGTWIGSREKVWIGLLKAPILARSISSFGSLWIMMCMLRNLQIYPSLMMSNQARSTEDREWYRIIEKSLFKGIESKSVFMRIVCFIWTKWSNFQVWRFWYVTQLFCFVENIRSYTTYCISYEGTLVWQ